MSSGLPSDEVAEDYKNSLEDLTTNDKFQISNLTVIAKENTEHAMAISRVLENHIRTVGACPSLSSARVMFVYMRICFEIVTCVVVAALKKSSNIAFGRHRHLKNYLLCT